MNTTQITENRLRDIGYKLLMRFMDKRANHMTFKEDKIEYFMPVKTYEAIKIELDQLAKEYDFNIKGLIEGKFITLFISLN